MKRLCSLLLVAGVLSANAVMAPAAQEDDVRGLLDSIREDLVELRLERALAALEGLLGDPGMTETERGEALVLRAQAHVAFGDLDAAEVDYRQILELRPGYEPAPSLTPEKALKRFRKIQAATVGHVLLELDPADASLSMDGRELLPPPDGRVALLAGSHLVSARRAGHDPLEREITVTAGEESSLRLELVPNARTVIVRTVPAGVDVRIDGQWVGVTADPGAGLGRAGELVIENLPLGDHVFDLTKPCFRTRRIMETLAVNLLDRSPLRLATVELAPVSSTLVLRGGPAGGEVRLDGATLGLLPLEPQPACPGARELEVRLGARTIWHSFEQLLASRETVVEVEARPNVALLGSKRWPRGLDEFAEAFNARTGLPLPAAADLSEPSAWSSVTLPPDTDLALAVAPARREGTADRWYLFSPILRVAQRLDRVPRHDRPAWSRAMWGFSTVDAAEGGPVLVAVVRESGPASSIGLSPGDRLVGLGGRRLEATEQVRATLDSASPGSPIEIEWVTVDGTAREGRLLATQGPLLRLDHPPADQAALRAAWAAVDIAREAPDAVAARANLALLFSAFGQHELAVDTWNQVTWTARPGIGAGTTQYYLGRALQELGREELAIEAYRRAAASEATTLDDEGPAVAPAARDRLADLGQGAEQPSAP